MVTSLPLSNQRQVVPSKIVLKSPVTALRFDQQVETVIEWGRRHESRSVCVANVHMVMEAYWHPEFAEILHKSDIVTPDGMPLVWMLRLLGAVEQDRVAGMEFFMALCQEAERRNLSVSFVGSHPAILERIEARLHCEFPNLRIAGMEPLPFRPLTQEEDDALVERIEASGANLVFVSLGCPKQERWIAQHIGKVPAVMLGIGGVFPVYAGLHAWAPRWVRQSGLEWLYRLIQEPRRLWKRYATTIPPFVVLAAKQLLHRHLASSIKSAAVSAAQSLGKSSFQIEGGASEPIGEVLRRAGLISMEQIQEALQVQAESRHLRFGELLVARGWLKPETVDFFAEKLPQVATENYKYPLGYYLKSAGLLDDEQINAILEEQEQAGLRFGELTVRKGWVKQETINLLLNYTAIGAKSLSVVA